jgi:crossover junction endodeoxyribonuclease RuvC
MQRMVKMILGLDDIPTPNHAADALAVAICHALSPPLLHMAAAG